MSDYTFTQKIGRGLYAAGGGDLAAYDRVKQDAEQAKQKAILDQQERQMKAQQQAYDNEMNARQMGYAPVQEAVGAEPLNSTRQVSTMQVPGQGTYASYSFAENLKLDKLKTEASVAYNTAAARQANAMADAQSRAAGGAFEPTESPTDMPMPSMNPDGSLGMPNPSMPSFTQQLPAAPGGQSGMTQYPDADYTKQKKMMYVGKIPMPMEVPVLKPQIDDKQVEALSASTNTLNSLQMVGELLDKGVKTGWNTAQNEAIPGSDLYMKNRGTNDDIALRQVNKRMQSGYLKAETGSQRGFQEMNWYAPAMPTPDMPTEKYRSVVNTTTKLMELNVRNQLTSLDRSGARLGEANRQTLNQLNLKYPEKEFPFGMSQSTAEKKIKGHDKNVNTTKSGVTFSYKEIK